MNKLLRIALPLWLAIPALLPAQTALPSVQEVYKIFQAKCASCHDHASPEGNLDLQGSGGTELQRAVAVAGNLNAVPPNNAYALSKGYKRVYPGRPDRSFLFRKINGDLEPTIAALHANEGQPMPAYPGEALSNAEKEIIRQWILYGAKTSGTQFDKAVVESFHTTGGGRAFPDGPPPAPAPGEGFQVKMGPFYLAPDGEVEYYQKYELDLPADVEVNRVDFKISGYSHHFIAYNFTGNGAAAIPHGLRTNANHSNINLVAAVQEATDLRLPNATAFKWANDIVLDLNSHYINYSLTQPYQCEAYVNVYTQPTGTAEQEMFATLLVKPDIFIPNNGNPISASQAVFQPSVDSIYVWGLMGHTHQYGTGYKVWKRMPNGQKGELLYDAACGGGVPGCATPWFDYQHIPIRYWEPLLPIRWGHGIIHEANWLNDGPEPVFFGPTSDDEMMVLIAFYTLQPITVSTDNGAQPGRPSPQVLPNPAHGHCLVRVPGQQSIRQFRLFDALGRVLQQYADLPGDTVELPLTGLAPGLYWFELDGQTGKILVD
jgi:mono/diheme cytochrome c family protein